MLALVMLGAAGARADVLAEAQELRRQMQYDLAREKLGIALPDLQDEARARALLLLAQLTPDVKEARRQLVDAGRAARSPETRRRAALELARLDYARGSYRSALSRLRDQAGDPEAALLLAQTQVALEAPEAVRQALQPVRRGDLAQLLLGWATRQGGDAQRALGAFENIAKQRESDVLPTALLWKAECEAALGLRERALESCAELRERFAGAPEAQLVEPTLASLRRGGASLPAAEPSPARVLLQVGAFEDRANALRYQQALAAHVQHVEVEEIRDGSKRLYRVQVGPFETRDAAEAFGREQLEPRGYTWRVVRPGEAAR